MDEIVHGQKLGPFLGFYDVQERAVAELVKVVCNICSIPLETPRDKDGKIISTAMKQEDLNKYRGIIGHYMITTNKIDPIGFDFEKMLKRINEI